jgi:hypothetical protein
VALPVILPALIKLNWKDYFAAAAMAGTICVIGEGAPSKDPALRTMKKADYLFSHVKRDPGFLPEIRQGLRQIVLHATRKIMPRDAGVCPERMSGEAIEFKLGNLPREPACSPY